MNSRERTRNAATASTRRNSRYSNDTTKKQPPSARVQKEPTLRPRTSSDPPGRIRRIYVPHGIIDVNPAKIGVDNPQRRRTEKRPSESWAQLAEVASRLDSHSGALVMFAAATGLRPGEWIALERRDIDRQARVVYVRRAFRNGRLKCTKTEGSVRAVPLQEVALQALEQIRGGAETDLLFRSVRGAYFDLHNFRTREWKPAQVAAGIVPLRRVYDLRHMFATFALRAGVSTFDLYRYVGPAGHDRCCRRRSVCVASVAEPDGDGDPGYVEQVRN